MARSAEREWVCARLRGELDAGADRDPHGCIPSAGYTWCAALGRCVRLLPHRDNCGGFFVASFRRARSSSSVASHSDLCALVQIA